MKRTLSITVKTPEDQFKRFCDKVCIRLCRHFHVTNYDMKIVYDIETDPTREEGTVGAVIEINQAYLFFTLTIYRNTFRCWLTDPAKAFHNLVHEFCHFLTLPPYTFAEPHLPDTVKDYYRLLMERQTELITRLLLVRQDDSVREFFDRMCYPEAPNERKRHQTPKPDQHREGTGGATPNGIDWADPD